MTIRANRKAAAGLAAISVFVDVVFGFSAFLLGGKPGFFYLIGLVVAAQIFAVGSLLRPASLGLEGAEVVYRQGRREKRVPRADVVNCKQVGATWVFSNSAGAQLLTLPIVRFSDTEVAAFCAHAEISVTGASSEPVEKLRRDVSSGKAGRALGVAFAVILIAATGGLLYWQQHVQDDLSRYQAAPACNQGAPSTSGCRLETQARVTSVKSNSSFTTLHMTLVSSGGDYVASVANPGPNMGDAVEVEVWEGDVTKINGRDTVQNPAQNPNLHLDGAIAVPALFALLALVAAGMGQYQLMTARARLRIAAAAAAGGPGAVTTVSPDAKVHGLDLPPCGVLHQPTEMLFVHEDPGRMKSGMAVLSVIAVLVLSGVAAGAIYVSVPVFAAIGVLVLAFYADQMIGGWRELRFAGLFADDLHVGRVTTDWIGRRKRKVYDRKSVLEVTIQKTTITVVGVDGSTLFWTTLISQPDMERYAEFLRVRVVHVTPEQADSIAVPPVQTPAGVLPLQVRRAAGIMQTIGGLLVGLAVINLIRVPGTPADRRSFVLVLLGVLAVYGAILYLLGLMLARGRPHSRDLAVIGGGAATAAFIASFFVIAGNPLVAVLIAATLVPFYALAVYWLRPAKQRGR